MTLGRLLDRYLDIPTELYPDPGAYWRARTMLLFVLINLAVGPLYWLWRLFSSSENAARIGVVVPGIVLFLLLSYAVTRAGQRVFIRAGWVLLPALLLFTFLGAWRHRGILDVNALGFYFAMVFAGLFGSGRAVALATAFTVPAYLLLGLGTMRGWIGAPLHLEAAVIESYTASMMQTSLNVGIMLILAQRLHDRLQADAVEKERRRQAALQRAEALAELDRLKTSFFHNISHEFRTPITLALGNLEEALADVTAPLPPSQRARIDMAARSGRRLRKLVSTLLEFARLEAGRWKPDPEPVDLAALTRDLCAEFRSAAERAGLTLRVDCPPLPGPVPVDRGMWEKIVLNLLSNAIKFTLEGSIDVRLRAAGDQVALSVRDTGCGISPAEQERLFERFHLARSAAARSVEGSGLGLALVHELLALQGGNISVENTPGGGATFTVLVPLSDVIAAPDGPLSSSPSPPGSAPGPLHMEAGPYVEEVINWLTPADPSGAAPPGPPAQGGDQRPLREPAREAVICDDNADMRAFLISLLGSRFAVRAAASGREALTLCRERVPALVLADVMMPDMDGLALLRALRAEVATAHVSVVMLSARAGVECAAEALAEGADDYLIKPFSPRDLLSRVEAHVDLARSRSQAAREKEVHIGMVAHELRNPLAAAKGFADLIHLRQGRGLALEPQHLAQLRSAIGRLEVLIRDLVQSAQIESGRLSLSRERVDLAALCREEAERIAVATGRPIELDIPAGEMAVECDPVRIGQVLANLLGNAHKYSPAGSVLLTLRVEERAVLIGVKDEGPGIPREQQENVFRQFFRVPGSAGGSISLGLGLYICRELVLRHRGRIWVESMLGRGSTFCVSLPR